MIKDEIKKLIVKYSARVGWWNFEAQKESKAMRYEEYRKNLARAEICGDIVADLEMLIKEPS